MVAGRGVRVSPSDRAAECQRPVLPEGVFSAPPMLVSLCVHVCRVCACVCLQACACVFVGVHVRLCVCRVVEVTGRGGSWAL